MRPVAALLLLLIVAPGCSGGEPRPRAARNEPTHARVVTIEVGGMTCAECERKIDASLERVPGVTAVRVSLAERAARVTCAPGVPDTALVAAVRRAGPEYLGLIVSR